MGVNRSNLLVHHYLPLSYRRMPVSNFCNPFWCDKN